MDGAQEDPGAGVVDHEVLGCFFVFFLWDFYRISIEFDVFFTGFPLNLLGYIGIWDFMGFPWDFYGI
jgi:hypothetical protein